MNKVYLACYRGRGDKLSHRLCDGITRFLLVANTAILRLPLPCLTVVTNAIHESDQGWRFSPVQLYEICNKRG